MTWRLATLAMLLTACSRTPQPWFQDVAAQSGLRFTHVTGATGKFQMPEIMGSGCAVLDYDQDGDLDIFLVQGAPGASGSRLFRNELVPSGSLAFHDVSASSGIKDAGYGMGAATGDFDNDGRPDLLVTYFGSNVLYRNNGDGTFRDVTAESPGIALPGLWSTSASFFDYDRDGWQDVAILNYIDYSFETNKACFAATGEIDYCTPRVYRSLPSRLFHNERGKFIDVSTRTGITAASGPGLGVAAFDANDDGWPDLFVANDSSANLLWVNRQDGTFAERALAAGVAYAEDGKAKAGMGVALGDYDNDRDEDLIVLNLMREGATLFRNDGRGSYTDTSLTTGLHGISFLFTGFGVGWADFDRDGWLDLFMANGAVTRREEQRGQAYPFQEKNLLIRNTGRAARFENVSPQAGPSLSIPGVARGAAFGDIDNDGDIDILLNMNNGPARLLRNDMPGANWLSVLVQGPGLGIGDRVEIKPAGLPAMVRYIRTDSSYLSANDARAHFGLGQTSEIEWVTVQRHGRTVTRVTRPRINNLLRIALQN